MTTTHYPMNHPPHTLGRIIELLLAADTRDAALDVLDHEWLLGPWGHVLDPEVNTENEIRPSEARDLCKNIRGLAWSLIKEVRRAERERDCAREIADAVTRLEALAKAEADVLRARIVCITKKAPTTPIEIPARACVPRGQPWIGHVYMSGTSVCIECKQPREVALAEKIAQDQGHAER